MILDSNTENTALTAINENALMAIAQYLGLIVTTEEAKVMTDIMKATPEVLQEQVSIVRLNRDAKLAAFVTRSALVIAQQKGDPLFIKYARASKLKREIRDQLLKKYNGQATVTARKLLANAGKKNMVDVGTTALSHPDSRA